MLSFAIPSRSNHKPLGAVRESVLYVFGVHSLSGAQSLAGTYLRARCKVECLLDMQLEVTNCALAIQSRQPVDALVMQSKVILGRKSLSLRSCGAVAVKQCCKASVIRRLLCGQKPLFMLCEVIPRRGFMPQLCSARSLVAATQCGHVQS